MGETLSMLHLNCDSPASTSARTKSRCSDILIMEELNYKLIWEDNRKYLNVCKLKNTFLNILWVKKEINGC